MANHLGGMVASTWVGGAGLAMEEGSKEDAPACTSGCDVEEDLASVKPREDEALCEAVRGSLRGDRRAMKFLYETRSPGIMRFCRRMMGSQAPASDATQETFVRAFRALGSLTHPARFDAWLFGIARRVSLELRRGRKVDRQRVHAVDPDSVSSGQVCPEAKLLERETMDRLEGALLALSEDRRAILLFRADHGLSHEEIANVMGWSVVKVRVEICRARAMLRERLGWVKNGGMP